MSHFSINATNLICSRAAFLALSVFSSFSRAIAAEIYGSSYAGDVPFMIYSGVVCSAFARSIRMSPLTPRLLAS